MADSSIRAHAHNKKAFLTYIATLNEQAKNQLFELLPLIISEKIENDRKTLLVLTDNGQQRYTGLSLDIATTTYLSPLRRALSDVQHGISVDIAFYAIDRHDKHMNLSGVQS